MTHEPHSTTRVLIVDDDPLVCAHLRTILGVDPHISVLDQVHDGQAALDAVRRHTPDLVLMDLRMPVRDGISATQEITALPAPPVVVALTTFDADEYVLRALHAGASGFLLKSTPPEELASLVRVAAQGHTVMSPEATRRLLACAHTAQSHRLDRATLVASLTERETEVLTGLGEGLTNGQIAGRLFLTEATVKGHVSRLLEKLGCDNRTQAGLLAYEAGLR
ncbi:response regulator transcription factor [Nocardiopsis ganjiahuensis]|uniref:response regulator transcription factor n=1 Tax=Nocardiopsis ganjiahuensis TaxID=239984 RepID=UPI0003465EF6|nr:response regulator transcription factor [Nocardiopsis ganjiahuensis]